MKAALYCRKSQENEENIRVQVDNARAFALTRGWSVVDANIFTDDASAARSSTTDLDSPRCSRARRPSTST